MNIRSPSLLAHTAEQIRLTGIALLVSYSTGVWSVPRNYTNYYCILHKREEGGRSTKLFLVINVGMQWEGTRERLVHNYCKVSSSVNALYHPNFYPAPPRTHTKPKPQKWLNPKKILQLRKGHIVNPSFNTAAVRSNSRSNVDLQRMKCSLCVCRKSFEFYKNI